MIHKVPGSPGYDHNFCVTKGGFQDEVFVAKVSHPQSGRAMEVYSNQPGVQFYTGNFLPEDGTLKGKGAPIQKHGAFCLETQIYPDAINQVCREIKTDDTSSCHLECQSFKNIEHPRMITKIRTKTDQKNSPEIFLT